MYLFETIKCYNGKLYNLEYHQERLIRSLKECFDTSKQFKLEDIIKIPDHAKTGLYKCRITYAPEPVKTEFIPYIYRKVKSLKLIGDNDIIYNCKFSNRENLERLFGQRGSCDDILIVKNNCITDSLAANVIFFDGKQWWTPDTPLLRGTQRSYLIDVGILRTRRITPADLTGFTLAGLINAMQDLETMPVISVSDIIR